MRGNYGCMVRFESWPVHARSVVVWGLFGEEWWIRKKNIQDFQKNYILDSQKVSWIRKKKYPGFAKKNMGWWMEIAKKNILE